MIFLKEIRKKTGSFLLKRKVEKLSRNKQFINLANALSVGIIYQQSDHRSFEFVDGFVKELAADDKQVFAIGYIEAKKIPDFYLLRKRYNFFSMKDTNWFFKPEATFIDDFLEREFDLLINLSIDPVFPIEYIYAISKARFKTGKYFGENDHSDLSIDIKDSRDISYLAEQIKHYLNLINKKN